MYGYMDHVWKNITYQLPQKSIIHVGKYALGPTQTLVYSEKIVITIFGPPRALKQDP